MGYARGGTAHVSVELLGPPAVLVGGRPLQVDTRKATALLAVVAVDGPTARATLAARLWPESDDVRARNALRRTLSVLVTGLGGRGLRTNAAAVAIDEDDVTVDTASAAAQLRLLGGHGHATDAVCRACTPVLRRAAGLHRGEFLSGFTVRDSAEFDEWRSSHAERLRRQRCTVLERLARAEADGGDLDAAVEATRTWLDIDQLNEQAHGRMMLLHAWRGERGAAIRCYRECTAVLERELGVRPLAGTSRLHQAILEGRLERTTPTAVAGRPSPPASGPGGGDAHRAEPPFVGRDTELGLAPW